MAARHTSSSAPATARSTPPSIWAIRRPHAARNQTRRAPSPDTEPPLHLTPAGPVVAAAWTRALPLVALPASQVSIGRGLAAPPSARGPPFSHTCSQPPRPIARSPAHGDL